MAELLKKSKKIKCGVCNKKITMMYIQCKCNEYFCKDHIYINEHNCQYDHKKHQSEKIRKNNPIIKKVKLEKI